MHCHTIARLIVTLVLFLSLAMMAAAGPYDGYLKASDIEKTAGLKGVKSIERNPSIGAGGDLNFATADGKLIVMIQVVSKSQYAGYKQYFFKSDIKGVGEQAMEGTTIPGMPPNLVAFTKGVECVALTAFGDQASDGKKNMLTIDQMKALAKTIASRMK